ncbi:rod-determining factor RdfA [Halomicroarcula sp. GCM10025324]|uniref:rod-determining factor RdfA n=1 Tax=Haloarcula TaxID=2237 RepID=UPI0023E847B9|nr:rod-determining factor RdfA [Halomicroarcula sp. ZS-22-S1]
MVDATEDRPSSKVARLIDEYDLDGFGAELEARWTGTGEERLSLRDLATLFNKRLLEQTLLDAGMNALEANVDMTYRNLTDEDVSTGVQTDTRSRLERNGIDVDALQSDFVTYQAIRSYLKEWRGAAYEGPSDDEKIQKDLESIQRLMTRTMSVTEERIEKLRNSDRFELGDFEVFLDAQVLCQECGSQYSVSELFDQRGCECQRD